MANGISSENLVIELGKAGWMGSFGAGGLSPARIEAAIQKIKDALPNGPYAFNLLNSPNDPALEERVVDLYLQQGIRVIEASAYLAMTAPLVCYRASGLVRAADGNTIIGNRVIAKLSRVEMAQRSLEPAPLDILNQLVEEKRISPLQAELARQVPMADDITVEADSGGHTDNRHLVGMFHPLEYKVVTFYQASYGAMLKQARLELKDRDSGKTHDVSVPYREAVQIPERLKFSSRLAIKLVILFSASSPLSHGHRRTPSPVNSPPIRHMSGHRILKPRSPGVSKNGTSSKACE